MLLVSGATTCAVGYDLELPLNCRSQDDVVIEISEAFLRE
jgi:hypothetical protein